MIRSPATTGAVVAATVVATALAVALGAPAPIRVPVGLLFLFGCPGLAFAPLVRIDDLWGRLTLVVCISAALDLIVATGFMYAGASSPRVWFGALAVVCLIGAALQVGLEWRRS
jgi:hypothetical protein